MQTYAPQLRELTLAYRVRRTVDGDAICFGGSVTDTNDAAKILLAILADESSEVFVMLCFTPGQPPPTIHAPDAGDREVSRQLARG